MTTIKKKVDYVKKESKRNTTFDHHCHWPDCEESVPPGMWGCKKHWFKLPSSLRAKIWATYEPGQEVSKDPSETYLAVTKEVQKWIREHPNA